MGLRILECREVGDTLHCDRAVLFCSTTDIAFGPVIWSDDYAGATEIAQAFIDWLPMDARRYQQAPLMDKWWEFLKKREAGLLLIHGEKNE